MPTHKHYFIEPTQNGRYRILAANARKASATAETEAEAIALVKKLSPDDHPDISRVRNVQTGGRDQWRGVRSRTAA